MLTPNLSSSKMVYLSSNLHCETTKKCTFTSGLLIVVYWHMTCLENSDLHCVGYQLCLGLLWCWNFPCGDEGWLKSAICDMIAPHPFYFWQIFWKGILQWWCNSVSSILYSLTHHLIKTNDSFKSIFPLIKCRKQAAEAHNKIATPTSFFCQENKNWVYVELKFKKKSLLTLNI